MLLGTLLDQRTLSLQTSSPFVSFRFTSFLSLCPCQFCGEIKNLDHVKIMMHQTQNFQIYWQDNYAGRELQLLLL